MKIEVIFIARIWSQGIGQVPNPTLEQATENHKCFQSCENYPAGIYECEKICVQKNYFDGVPTNAIPVTTQPNNSGGVASQGTWADKFNTKTPVNVTVNYNENVMPNGTMVGQNGTKNGSKSDATQAKLYAVSLCALIFI